MHDHHSRDHTAWNDTNIVFRLYRFLSESGFCCRILRNSSEAFPAKNAAPSALGRARIHIPQPPAHGRIFYVNVNGRRITFIEFESEPCERD
jgi:hypothetical protein